jgi:hypothetical protein
MSELHILLSEIFVPKYDSVDTRDQLLSRNSIDIPDKFQVYIIEMLNKHAEIFYDIQQSLDKIVSDNKIDAKDTPELLAIVGKIYELLYKSKFITNKVDYYEMISHLLYVSSAIYLRKKNKCNQEILDNISSIMTSSIELIKLKSSIKPPKMKFKFF